MVGGCRTGCGSGSSCCCPSGLRIRLVVTTRGCPTVIAMDALRLVLRTGMQWNALDATGIANSKTAHRRFQEWERAGVFQEIWRRGLLAYDEQVGIDWAWLAADGAMSKAPLGGPKTGPNPTDRAKRGRSARSSPRARVSRSG